MKRDRNYEIYMKRMRCIWKAKGLIRFIRNSWDLYGKRHVFIRKAWGLFYKSYRTYEIYTKIMRFIWKATGLMRFIWNAWDVYGKRKDLCDLFENHEIYMESDWIYEIYTGFIIFIQDLYILFTLQFKK